MTSSGSNPARDSSSPRIAARETRPRPRRARRGRRRSRLRRRRSWPVADRGGRRRGRRSRGGGAVHPPHRRRDSDRLLRHRRDHVPRRTPQPSPRAHHLG
ncbi:MAG TPA: hypothetical protein ENK55_07770 [Actinobacteria bacterium]|nr:hypothetical protein [Actinomycetota bacterium]